MTTLIKSLKSMKPAYFLFAFLILLNCDGVEKKSETVENFCGVLNPATELIWLKEIIDLGIAFFSKVPGLVVLKVRFPVP